MKHPHPMITPLIEVDAADVHADFGGDSAKLFDLLSEASTAHSLAQEVISVEHLVVDMPNFCLRGLAEVDCNPVPSSASLTGVRFEAVRQRPREDEPSIDALLEWIAAKRLMSPARMSEVFDELEKAGLVDQTSSQLEMTPRAHELVKFAQQSGWQRFNCSTYESWRSSCDECKDGRLDLERLMGKAEDLFGLELPSLAEQVRHLASLSLE